MSRILDPFEQRLVDLIKELILWWQEKNECVGIKQEELADRLNIDRATLSKLLNGDQERTNLTNIKALITGLGLLEDDKCRLHLCFYENEIKEVLNVEPKLLSPEAELQRAMNTLRRVTNGVLLNSDVCRDHKILRTFTALWFNPGLLTQVESLIEYADSLRPLDGLHPIEKTEEEKALELLEKARKEQLAQHNQDAPPLEDHVPLA